MLEKVNGNFPVVLVRMLKQLKEEALFCLRQLRTRSPRLIILPYLSSKMEHDPRSRPVRVDGRVSVYHTLGWSWCKYGTRGWADMAAVIDKRPNGHRNLERRKRSFFDIPVESLQPQEWHKTSPRHGSDYSFPRSKPSRLLRRCALSMASSVGPSVERLKSSR
jgi:hypothetical protein